MDVIFRSNNNPVNDITALMSGLINDLDKFIKTKSSQSQTFGVVVRMSILDTKVAGSNLSINMFSP